MDEPGPCTVREAVFEDCEAATELLRRLGLIMPEGRDAVRAHWDRLWRTNPAMLESGPKPALGWVLEDGGRMVGFFGNVPLLYDLGGRAVMVADASQWGVEKAYRHHTPRLADAYFDQVNADLLLVTTAIKPTGRLFESRGAVRVPQPDYDRVLYWVVEPFGFARAALRKKGVPAPRAQAGAAVAGPALGAAVALGGRRPGRRGAHVVRMTPSELNDEFDALWQRVRDETPCLLARRDAQSLKWWLGAPALRGRARLLAYRCGGLGGYAIVVRDDAPAIGLKRLKIADMFVAGGSAEMIDALLAEAFALAREEGYHVLELVGLPRSLRSRARALRPYSRPMPVWPLYYKTVDGALAQALSREEAWYVTAYDGDTLLV